MYVVIEDLEARHFRGHVAFRKSSKQTSLTGEQVEIKQGIEFSLPASTVRIDRN